ncbi:hypothetical protein D3C73_793930 [compost metagenome]
MRISKHRCIIRIIPDKILQLRGQRVKDTKTLRFITITVIHKISKFEAFGHGEQVLLSLTEGSLQFRIDLFEQREIGIVQVLLQLPNRAGIGKPKGQSDNHHEHDPIYDHGFSGNTISHDRLQIFAHPFIRQRCCMVLL